MWLQGPRFQGSHWVLLLIISVSQGKVLSVSLDLLYLSKDEK